LTSAKQEGGWFDVSYESLFPFYNIYLASMDGALNQSGQQHQFHGKERTRQRRDATALSDEAITKCTLDWAIESHGPAAFIFSEICQAVLMRP